MLLLLEKGQELKMGVAQQYRGPSGKILPGPRMSLQEVECETKELFRQKDICVAYLFGSYAYGQASAFSDVDLAIILDCGGDELYTAYRKLLLDLQRVLGTERIDLLLLNNVSPSWQFEIIRYGKLIYARTERELNNFEMKAIRRFLDTSHMRAVQNDYLKKRVREWYSEKKAY